MNDFFKEEILRITNSTSLQEKETIQSLWSGYGKIKRFTLSGSETESVVIKHILLPKRSRHPRGWNTDLSHQRKLKSYEVESAWYVQWGEYCTDNCRIPEFYGLAKHGDEVLIILEDLDDSGFSLRRTEVSLNDMALCLNWLANFHATFLFAKPDNIWEIGTYWHLETRPEELKALDDIPLKKAAKTIDSILNETPYKTFVHGDAKLANFCFSEDGKRVAAVDFQYVGGGCGMKDVAYFIGSCLHEDECEQYEAQLLDIYFGVLLDALNKRQVEIDLKDLESNWRSLYPIAWTDFHRFLKGWSPEHWKIHSYSERISREVIAKLENTAM